jgi:hypothetical protein
VEQGTVLDSDVGRLSVILDGSDSGVREGVAMNSLKEEHDQILKRLTENGDRSIYQGPPKRSDVWFYEKEKGGSYDCRLWADAAEAEGKHYYANGTKDTDVVYDLSITKYGRNTGKKVCVVLELEGPCAMETKWLQDYNISLDYWTGA